MTDPAGRTASEPPEPFVSVSILQQIEDYDACERCKVLGRHGDQVIDR